MGRPAEFDRDDALEAAIRVFARQGFAAASTSDLLGGMGIGRQSLYGAFGDKRSLFLDALKRYSDASLLRMRKALEQEPSAMKALEAALLIDLGCGGDLEDGCLGVGSIVEFGRSDPDINALSDAAALALSTALTARLRDGIASGELKSDLDADIAGRMLLTVKSGLKIAARGGASDREVTESVRLILTGLSAD